MNWRKFLPLIGLVGAFVLLVANIPVGATDAAAPSGAQFVRVPATAVDEAAALGLNPSHAFDYGSYHWLELSEADFATLSASGLPFTHVPDAGKIQTTRYQFDPVADGEPAVPAESLRKSGGPGLHLVQFHGPTNDAWLSGLDAAGLQVLQYYPHYTYLVWGTSAQLSAVESLEGVRWQGPFHPAYKIDQNLDERSGVVKNVDIFFYNDGKIDATLAAIESLGGNILQSYPAQPDKAFYDAVVELDAAVLEDVARLDSVVWLGYLGPEPILDDEMSSQIVAGNHPGGVPVTGYFAHLANLGVDGTGVTWAIIDTGVDYDHPDLGPHIVGGYSYPGACNTNPGDDCSGGGHGTHVAGIVGGDASGGFTDPNGFLYGLGMAPGYGIFASNSLSAGAWPPAGGWQEHSKRAVLGGAIGGNNSWTTGEGTQHGYQASERTHDIMVHDGNFDTTTVAEPFIEVFSAGNSGGSGLTAPKEGKNLIITASSRNYRAGSIDAISSFSSRGPAVDGRWVPTIAAPGEDIASARNDLGGSCSTAIPGTSNLYAFCSGTSMAAPHTSGTIVLATEWWRGFNAGADPSPAMAKALLVNTAVDMGAADIPNINEGWGRLNITNIVSASVPTLYYDQVQTFGNSGEQWTLSGGVADPTKPLKITLAWNDAPGAAGANPALVNDLDLTVVNGGSTYLGNQFSGGWSTTGGAADSINNLENVYIQSPGSGFVITIDAINISGDGVFYNGDATDQDFALICQNCVLSSDFTLTVTPNPLAVCAPADAVYTVDVDSILGFSDPVTLSAAGNPAGTTTNFSANPVNPPGSSALTIGSTGAAAAGSYSIDIVGMAPTSTHTTTVGLDLFDMAPGAPSLTSPPDGATGVSSTPMFVWTGAAQGDTYTIEIATDPAFSNIIDTATVADITYTPATALPAGTTLYWRVWAANPCGSGSFSQTFSFTTLTCAAPNLAIPDNNPAGVTDDLVLTDSGSISDLDISILVQHTWVGDVVFELEHVDTGTSVTFYDRPGVPASTFGCSGNDIDATLDDEAATPVENECGAGTPTINGSFIPNNPLSAFDGESIAGTWRITASDHAGGDTGALLEWCVQAVSAYSASLTPSASAISALPGSTVVHDFTLANTGQQDDVYDLTVGGASWPTTLLTGTPLNVTAGSTATVSVEVDVPAVLETVHGMDTFTLTVASQGDPGLMLTATGTTTSETTSGIDLSTPQPQTGLVGQVLTYTVAVTNTGNYTDTFAITVGPHGWTTTAPASVGPLGPGQSATVEVLVTVGAGTSDSAMVTFTSTLDPAVSASVTLDSSTYVLFMPAVFRP